MAPTTVFGLVLSPPCTKLVVSAPFLSSAPASIPGAGESACSLEASSSSWVLLLPAPQSTPPALASSRVDVSCLVLVSPSPPLPDPSMSWKQATPRFVVWSLLIATPSGLPVPSWPVVLCGELSTLGGISHGSCPSGCRCSFQ